MDTLNLLKDHAKKHMLHIVIILIIIIVVICIAVFAGKHYRAKKAASGAAEPMSLGTSDFTVVST